MFYYNFYPAFFNYFIAFFYLKSHSSLGKSSHEPFFLYCERILTPSSKLLNKLYVNKYIHL